jgi:hypothetical protein
MEIRQPTLENKKLMQSKRLNPNMWLVVWEDKDALEVISKRSKMRRVLKKGDGEGYE